MSDVLIICATIVICLIIISFLFFANMYIDNKYISLQSRDQKIIRTLLYAFKKFKEKIDHKEYEQSLIYVEKMKDCFADWGIVDKDDDEG